jgi:hypothetical protein
MPTTHKKKKLIIRTKSSSTLSEKTKKRKELKKPNEPKESKKPKEPKKQTTKKKKIKIMNDLSISSLTFTPELKEKIEGFNPGKIGEQQKDLKISQDIHSKMSKIPSGRLNEKFIELMEQLANIMMKQGQPFRSRAYQKAQETIMAYPDDITNPDQLKGKPGIGSTIMDKLFLLFNFNTADKNT